MKSIMEEASSIIKAIEKGWVKAGQPKEFSVKIFEEPQKNFIGLTVKSAKIGIFFNDVQTTKVQEQITNKPKPYQKQQQPAAFAQTKSGTKAKARPLNLPKENRETKGIKEAKEKQDFHVERLPERTENLQNIEATSILTEDKQDKQKTQSIWTESMLSDIQQWLSQTLEIITNKSMQFSIDPQLFHLKIQFNDEIFEDKNREKQLFSSLATLLIQMLKQKYRRPLKGYKIIFIGKA